MARKVRKAKKKKLVRPRPAPKVEPLSWWRPCRYSKKSVLVDTPRGPCEISLTKTGINVRAIESNDARKHLPLWSVRPVVANSVDLCFTPRSEHI